MEAKSRININISRKNHRRLREIGSLGQTYDDVLEQLLTFWEDHHKE